MKNQILNLGNALNKSEQKQINGGNMDATCEELGWNEYTCANVGPEDQVDRNYYKCC